MLDILSAKPICKEYNVKRMHTQTRAIILILSSLIPEKKRNTGKAIANAMRAPLDWVCTRKYRKKELKTRETQNDHCCFTAETIQHAMMRQAINAPVRLMLEIPYSNQSKRSNGAWLKNISTVLLFLDLLDNGSPCSCYFFCRQRHHVLFTSNFPRCILYGIRYLI